MAPGGGRGGAAGGAGKARAATVVPEADAGSPPSKTRGHRALSDVLCASLWADFSEKIPLRYSKSTSGLLEQNRVPHGYSSSKNVVFATHGVETVVLATHGFADLPLDYLTPSSPTSPLPDPFIYHSPTNVFFRYIICSKFVKIKFSKVVTRSRRVRA